MGEGVVADEDTTLPTWTYQVRLFAGHRVEGPDGTALAFRYGEPGVPNRNTRRGAELLTYLALGPERAASLDDIRDHLWWGKPISPRTADTLVSGTRQLLGGGDYISHAEGDPGNKRYRLQPTVITDLETAPTTKPSPAPPCSSTPSPATEIPHAADTSPSLNASPATNPNPRRPPRHHERQPPDWVIVP